MLALEDYCMKLYLRCDYSASCGFKKTFTEGLYTFQMISGHGFYKFVVETLCLLTCSLFSFYSNEECEENIQTSMTIFIGL